MPDQNLTTVEIHQEYLSQHELLGRREDATDLELFDHQHRQLWHDCDDALRLRMETIRALPSPTPEELAELYILEVMFPPEPQPDPDYDRACELLNSSPDVITAPQMWKLLRIFGKRLGYHFD